MKHICKGPEPAAFYAWKELKNEDWQPDFEDLRGEPKVMLVRSLLQEQGYLCCYCERSIDEQDCHVEHFQPQSDPRTDSLDYQNLHASCQRELRQGEPRHCGNLKGEWFEEAMMISPLDPDCEGRFSYLANGEIRPAISNDRAAVATIAHLGLDCTRLRSFRSAALLPFLDDSLSQQDIHQFVSGYLKMDPEGHFRPFWTTINQLFGQGLVK